MTALKPSGKLSGREHSMGIEKLHFFTIQADRQIKNALPCDQVELEGQLKEKDENLIQPASSVKSSACKPHSSESRRASQVLRDVCRS